jgi:DNA-directed RNA polymerase specialized sigma24 family protein
MHAARSQPFWLSPWEATGMPRSSAMIDAARRIWEPVLVYTHEALGDTDSAAEFLEKTVCSVEKSREKHTIQDLSAYIFRSYINEIAVERRRRRRLMPLEVSTSVLPHQTEEIERRVLAQEVVAAIRVDLLPLVFRRMDGWSWEEIALQLGEPKHALESRYSYEMRRVKKLLTTRK